MHPNDTYVNGHLLQRPSYFFDPELKKTFNLQIPIPHHIRDKVFNSANIQWYILMIFAGKFNMSLDTRREAIDIFMITNIKVVSASGTETIVDGEAGTTYHGPPEKASEYFQSPVYQNALFSAIQKSNIESFKAIHLEIKHKQI